MANNNFKEGLKYPRIYSNPEQQDIQEKLTRLLDEYQTNNSFENREYLCYLSAAIFLTYKKLYPQLSIYIPFRIKGDISYMQNISKEFRKFIQNLDSKVSFDTFAIEKDISALKIVLDNINFSLPSTPESDALFNDLEIRKLMGNSEEDKKKNTKEYKKTYSRHENFNFVDEVNDYIQSPIKNGKQYFELKKELLERIIKITPSKFENERKPDPSFLELYDKITEDYNFFLEEDNFPTTISDLQITELKVLLNDFRSRIDDKLHFAILRKTLPIVLEQPLIKHVLKTSSKFEKESTKSNGFQAMYITTFSPFGPIEVQAQSNRAYYTATKGSAYHSGKVGKSINIKDFFELVDSSDEYDVSYYLDTLDSVSADSMISPYEIPEFKTEQEKEDFFNTSTGIAYLKSEKYREMMKHIKIKEEIELIPENLPKDVYDSNNKIDLKKLQEKIDHGEILQTPTTVNANEYLLSTALSLSPYMNVCSSGHTSFTDAGIHHKKVIGEFSEILRKRDSNTCLRDMLIRRLEELIEHPETLIKDSKTMENISFSLSIVDKHDEMATRLPKNISPKNVISYGEKLRNRQKSNSDLDLVI